MVEQVPLAPNEIAKKVIEVIDGLLTTGSWDSSVFLKASAARLRGLRTQAERLSHFGEKKQSDTPVGKALERRAVPSGYTQVFILLYQVDGANLQGWSRNIKTLIDYSVTRPAYKDESFAKEAVRSKVASIERNGYVVVNVKNDAFYSAEQAPTDNFGHQLFVLKENSIKLENIVEFVHANKKHYTIGDNDLVLLDET
jgi:Dot/Icm secretion system protein IcmQ